jgi:hypothetical protein
VTGLFDKNFLQNIVGGLVVLFISILLSGRAKSAPTSGKGGKIAIIVGWMNDSRRPRPFRAILPEGWLSKSLYRNGTKLVLLRLAGEVVWPNPRMVASIETS